MAGVRRLGLFTVLLSVVALPAQASRAELLTLVEQMEASYAGVREYTATFRKQERLNGELRATEVIHMKFRKPLSIYMRWLSGPGAGREALFVDGSHDGKLLVWEPRGLHRFFTLLLGPRGSWAMRESLFPISDAGLGRLIERLGRDARRASARGEIRLIHHGEAEEFGRPARRVEGILPRDRGAGYTAYRLVVSIDRELTLPVRVVMFDWDDRVLAEYAYSDLRLNPGLQAHEFDPSNPVYGFPPLRFPLSD